MSRLRATLPALTILGCFSGGDFSTCTEDAHCGTGRICESGTCVIAATDDAPVLVEGEVTGELRVPERDVVLRDAVVTEGALVIVARRITVEEGVSADGAGHPGGAGGDGAPATRDVAEPAFAGRPGEGPAGGLAGAGAGPGAAGPDGAPAQWGDGSGRDVCTDSALFRLGNGGGGGGGGGGGTCGGGGGGGAGAAGGGAIVLLASESLTIRGPLTARGESPSERPAPSGAGVCDAIDCPACPAEDMERSGQGGGGSPAGEGGVGGQGAHAGGAGAAGSGGTVRLEAPTITFDDGAEIVLTGGDGAGDGVLFLSGSVVGSPRIDGTACDVAAGGGSAE